MAFWKRPGKHDWESVSALMILASGADHDRTSCRAALHEWEAAEDSEKGKEQDAGVRGESVLSSLYVLYELPSLVGFHVVREYAGIPVFEWHFRSWHLDERSYIDEARSS